MIPIKKILKKKKQWPGAGQERENQMKMSKGTAFQPERPGELAGPEQGQEATTGGLELAPLL